MSETYRVKVGCFTFEVDKLTGRHELVAQVRPQPGQWQLVPAPIRKPKQNT